MTTYSKNIRNLMKRAGQRPVGRAYDELIDRIKMLEGRYGPADDCRKALYTRLQLAQRVVKAVRHIPRYNRHGKLNDAIDVYDKEYNE